MFPIHEDDSIFAAMADDAKDHHGSPANSIAMAEDVSSLDDSESLNSPPWLWRPLDSNGIHDAEAETLDAEDQMAYDPAKNGLLLQATIGPNLADSQCSNSPPWQIANVRLNRTQPGRRVDTEETQVPTLEENKSAKPLWQPTKFQKLMYGLSRSYASLAGPSKDPEETQVATLGEIRSAKLLPPKRSGPWWAASAARVARKRNGG